MHKITFFNTFNTAISIEVTAVEKENKLIEVFKNLTKQYSHDGTLSCSILFYNPIKFFPDVLITEFKRSQKMVYMGYKFCYTTEKVPLLINGLIVSETHDS